MKKVILYFIPGVLLGIVVTFFLINSSSTQVETVFSPDNGEEILYLIDSAEESIYVEVYILSSETIIEKLIEAHNNGLEVKVILEKRMGGNNQEVFEELRDAGIDIRWASYDYKLTHAKIIIIDGSKVLVGSHNFSDSALYSNRETSVILEGSIVEEFIQLFYEDWVKATS